MNNKALPLALFRAGSEALHKDLLDYARHFTFGRKLPP
jgi:hypothetical protein